MRSQISPTLFAFTGTYGGHLELTAFSHLKRRDVKVIQPGLVYVIEWTSGADLSPTTPEVPLSEQIPLTPASPMKGRDARRVRREKKQQLKDKQASRKAPEQDGSDDDDDDTSLGAVYVACVLLSYMPLFYRGRLYIIAHV